MHWQVVEEALSDLEHIVMNVQMHVKCDCTCVDLFLVEVEAAYVTHFIVAH